MPLSACMLLVVVVGDLLRRHGHIDAVDKGQIQDQPLAVGGELVLDGTGGGGEFDIEGNNNVVGGGQLQILHKAERYNVTAQVGVDDILELLQDCPTPFRGNLILDVVAAGGGGGLKEKKRGCCCCCWWSEDAGSGAPRGGVYRGGRLSWKKSGCPCHEQQ